jgi:short-subunit dehydrogenase
MLTKRGYRVFATARKLADVEMLAAKGFESLPLDVQDSASIKNAVQEILSRTQGKLDVLCNNAGYGHPGAIEDLDRESLRKQFETNVLGLVELTNQVIPIMRKQGHGRIINISSILGMVALPYRGAYNASKFAVEGLTDTLRLELASSNIFVSLIEPGPIVSRFNDTALNVGRYIDIDRSAHQKAYQRIMQTAQVKHDSFLTLPPEAVAKKIIRAIESKKPKTRYFVGWPVYALVIAKRILPTRLFDRLLDKLKV